MKLRLSYADSGTQGVVHFLHSLVHFCACICYILHYTIFPIMKNCINSISALFLSFKMTRLYVLNLPRVMLTSIVLPYENMPYLCLLSVYAKKNLISFLCMPLCIPILIHKNLMDQCSCFLLSFQNSHQGSKFVKTGLDSLGNIRSSAIAPPKKVQPGSNGMLPPEQADMPSHLSISTKMPPSLLKSMPSPPPKNMPPPPPRSMPRPPPRFPSDELLPRNEKKIFSLNKPTAPLRPLDARSVSPSQLPPKEPKEKKTNGTPVSGNIVHYDILCASDMI